MTPEYINQLADIADPEKLWRLSGIRQQTLSDDQRKQLDMGVALRRHAGHIESVASLPEGKSLLITPLVYGRGLSCRQSAIDTPEQHRRKERE